MNIDSHPWLHPSLSTYMWKMQIQVHLQMKPFSRPPSRVQTSIISHLNHCNSLLSGFPVSLLTLSGYSQHSCQNDPIKSWVRPSPSSLQNAPIAPTTYKDLQNPAWLQSPFPLTPSPVFLSGSLNSSHSNLFVMPQTHQAHFQYHCLALPLLTAWNAHPSNAHMTSFLIFLGFYSYVTFLEIPSLLKLLKISPHPSFLST